MNGQEPKPEIKPLSPLDIRAYYSRQDILSRMFEMCKDREVIPVFSGGFYGKRPNSVQFPGDLLYFVKNNAVAFHCSVERWKNPQALGNTQNRAELDELRTGWDLVLDIDSAAGLGIAKIAAKLLMDEIRAHGVKNISIKFSGRRGFHIGIACGAFPKIVDNKSTAMQFPEIPQKIARYLRERIKKELAAKVIEIDRTLEEKMKPAPGNAKAEKNPQDCAPENSECFGSELDPFLVVEVEENWSVRHLFRMPYAFNDKTWNVSLPFDPARIMEFSPEEASPKKAGAGTDGASFGFLGKFEENEAEKLVFEALKFASKSGEKRTLTGMQAEKTATAEKKERLIHALYDAGVIVSDKIPGATQKELDEIMISGAAKAARKQVLAPVSEDDFPPCIKKISEGVADGRKRAVFIAINFLSSCGYAWDAIEAKLSEWNSKNPEPLPDSYWKCQLAYAKKQDKKILPPNCENAGYYRDIKICLPDALCARIKNPVSYAGRKAAGRKQEKRRKTKKAEKKASRNNPIAPKKIIAENTGTASLRL